VINKESSDATSKPKQQAMLAQHHHQSSSLAQWQPQPLLA